MFGCERCIQRGVVVNKRVVYLNTNSELRTYEDFVNVTFPEHQLLKSPLLHLDNFDLIKQLPLDYMHLCLGVMRKLLNYWLKGCETRSVKLPVTLRYTLCHCSLVVNLVRF